MIVVVALGDRVRRRCGGLILEFKACDYFTMKWSRNISVRNNEKSPVRLLFTLRQLRHPVVRGRGGVTVVCEGMHVHGIHGTCKK